ncbi:DUF397 domain-containing protein [Streptomyces sp. NPDC090088]|uniref:DUF397 domain-containing protein n=1 Tax=Streptomyces sp. NPDC090088 TaxID=3365944 RepID=UPI0037FEEDDD
MDAIDLKFPEWHRSRRSAQGNCVEVAFSGSIRVRDSKDPQRAILIFSAHCWISFVNSDPSAPRACRR